MTSMSETAPRADAPRGDSAAQRVAVVGDATSVSGFRPLGFAVYALDRPEEARTLWHELGSGFYAVVFVTEPVFEQIEDLAAEIHRDLPTLMKFARIWGAGRFDGQRAHRTEVLHDRDVLEIHQ